MVDEATKLLATWSKTDDIHQPIGVRWVAFNAIIEATVEPKSQETCILVPGFDTVDVHVMSDSSKVYVGTAFDTRMVCYTTLFELVKDGYEHTHKHIRKASRGWTWADAMVYLWNAAVELSEEYDCDISYFNTLSEELMVTNIEESRVFLWPSGKYVTIRYFKDGSCVTAIVANGRIIAESRSKNGAESRKVPRTLEKIRRS